LKCDYCGAEESLPFVCNYCGGVFCADHRLPEAHMCKGDLSQKRVIVAPPPTTFTWSDTSRTATGYPGPHLRSEHVFSALEVRDIAVAWLGLGVAFFLSFVSQNFGIGNLPAAVSNAPLDALTILGIELVTVGSGFVLHELSHKFTAQRYGYWAEFRMWPLGLVFALVTSLLGIIFAAPGATYISGMNISEAENGKISIAGPLTNVAVALCFLPIWLFLSSMGFYWHLLGFEGVFVNVFLAAFNLLPLMPLDGAKVFHWNKLIWAVLFFPLALIAAVVLFGL
jgi:Zn-dependent protease